MIKSHPVRSSLAKVPTGLVPKARARLLTGQKIVVIVGPTASGKSDLGIRIAQRFNGEIISADSRQVYRGMDIGTGKVPRDKTLHVPNLKFKNQNVKFGNFYSGGVRHYLLDVSSPKKQFTASDFKKLGNIAIEKILAKNKTPIIVGGTGFYIDILLDRMALAQVPPDKKLRTQLDKLTVKKLYEKLLELDPGRSEVIDHHNKHRLIRALEIVITTKESSLNSIYKIPDTIYEILWLGVNPDKDKLAERIKKRLDSRLGEGMIKEVKKLHQQKISWKRLDDFGLEYRWISRWLMKNLKIKMKNNNVKFKNSDEYKNLLRDIIKYSKRQMTWFKRNKDINWLIVNKTRKINNEKKATELIKKFLNS